MALTFGRWLLLTVGGCAIAWAGLIYNPTLPDRSVGDPGTLDQTYRYASPYRRLSGQLAQMNNRLRLLELRDSTAKATSGATGPLTIAFDGGLAATTQNRLDSLLRGRWNQLGEMHQVPTLIAVVVDTARHPRSLPRSFGGASIPIESFVPSAETGGRCVSLVHLPAFVDQSNLERARQTRANLSSPETIQAILGVCAFYSAFGPPGPAIRQWLAQSRWTAVKTPAWDTQPAPWSVLIGERGRAFSLADAVALGTDPSWEIRHYVGAPGIACLAGRSGACREALLPRSSNSDSTWTWSVASSSGTERTDFFLPRAVPALGPSAGFIVAEMVRSLGRDKFSRFWTSPLPPDDAFRAATGNDIDRWVRDWARHMYGPASVGPDLPLNALVAGLVLAFAAVGGAVIIGMRRRVL